ncbi:MAG: hypothetical protein M1814_001019 [Vezdaea aestivalis]|nr:MAG: hypothetical protein M1814_001019 [Vezdaea aestivalis]
MYSVSFDFVFQPIYNPTSNSIFIISCHPEKALVYDLFFAQFPQFDYQTNASSSKEFYRICDQFGWERDDTDRQEAHDGFKVELVQTFNNLFGTDEKDLQSWQEIYVALDISPPPQNIPKAKRTLKKKFINLVDLVDTQKTGKSVEQFQSLDELRDYTIKTGKFSPRDSAYAGGLLKFLLREILGSYAGRKRGSKRR